MLAKGGTNAKIFVYMGPGRERPLQDAVRVVVDPSVTSIPHQAFLNCKGLTKVKLFEGLVEIGTWSFVCCNHLITMINILSTVMRICNWDFHESLQT